MDTGKSAGFKSILQIALNGVKAVAVRLALACTALYFVRPERILRGCFA